jgi:peptidoglycan/xylan/chitin deacetylase (PgdA/CDA1 family)
MSKKRFFLLILFFFFFLDELSANAHIFVYHRFDDNRYRSTSISNQTLKNQFQYLKDNNYKVIPLSTLTDAISNNKPIDDKWVVLSIDDGYKSFYENGLKIFREFDYPFNLNIYVRATRKKYSDFLSWKQIKEISQYGEIGLHSYFHPHLIKMSDERIAYDTNLSVSMFEKYLGFKPTIYAYPYGEYNKRVQNIVSKYGLKIFLNQDNGAVSSSSKITNLNRLGLVGNAKLKEFLNYTKFEAKLIEPKIYPKNRKITKVIAKVYDKYGKIDKNITKAKLFITDNGWIDVEVKNGIINKDLNITLKKRRVRIIISDIFPNISNTLLIKDNR